ncbi:ABC transporter ATP-binding protein [Salinibacillus xinjiangensis]|uniref:ATP-binding cassette domain-containing protein n=1 Tax=Salinibacillus xinjiangensis TaxID=1229268 RepID=A0A6G1X872_9BACI|nr:ABC transporter ATP-binding protein [Salinibacillus xinjiangensis]MRG87164.1 ATP-binding cassette domain-containing protein [Salinibacillus xinjiangensis]
MVLSLQNVSLKRDGRWILENVDWNVEKGEHWVLFGLNGAGKTALLNMLNAYYFPTHGEVEVLGRRFGHDPLGEHLRTKIGLVSSSLQQKLYPDDNAFEVVLSGAFASIGLYDAVTDEMREKAISLLKELGCFAYANREYQTLSQGERQRVLIARALMGNPELLILDEPTSGLDFIAREQLLEAIESIATGPDAPTMIYVTHRVDEILPIFDQTLLLKSGAVFDSGRTRDMLSEQRLTAFFDVPVEVVWTEERPFLVKKGKVSADNWGSFG